MSSVGRGGQIRLVSSYFEYAGGSPYDPTEDGNDPTLIIYFGATIEAGPFVYSNGTGDVNRDSLGSYSYVFSIPTDAELGAWRAVWEGTIHGTTVTGEEVFNVIPTGSVNVGQGVDTDLGEDFIFTFTPGVSPLYIDPEEIEIIFPDAPYVDVLELIYKYSLEVDDIRGTNPVSEHMYDYVYAATACSLSKIYGGIGSVFGDENAVVLGDLSVTTSSRPRTAANVTIGNYGNWCELAFALRNLLTRGTKMVKPYVRGSNFRNPMPSRKIRRRRPFLDGFETLDRRADSFNWQPWEWEFEDWRRRDRP